MWLVSLYAVFGAALYISKVIEVSMDPQQTRKRPNTTTEFCDKNAKQREIYHNIPPSKKDALLLQRRINRRETTTKRILENTNSSSPAEPICVCRDNVDVGCSSSTSKTVVSASHIYTAPVALQREKRVVHPSKVFEKCSTLVISNASDVPTFERVSAIATERGALTPSKVVDRENNASHPFYTFEKGSTSGTANNSATKTFDTIRTNGLPAGKKITANIRRLQSDYVHLQKIPDCKFCGAKKFEYEAPRFCCGKGTIRLTSHRMPTNLKNLYMRNDAESKHFQTYIRTYNNLFAFTSLGVTYDRDLAKRNHGIYTFKVQGQMYHLIDSLYPRETKPRNLQLYFYDSTNEIENRMACSDKLHESTVIELMNILKDNPYSMFLRSLASTPNLQNFHIALKCDAGLDQRVYNLPTTTEIASIWVDDNDNRTTHAPHVQVYTHCERTQRINYYFGCYDPLQYPLLFPHGQGGWHSGIKKFHSKQNVRRNLALFELEQLPSIKNYAFVDEYLDMEAEIKGIS